MDQYFNNYQILDKFNVSRETFLKYWMSLEKNIKKNNEINLISTKS